MVVLFWMKAIFVPSGDHTGLESEPTSGDTHVCPLPSTFIVKMPGAPSRVLTNAIFSPVGETTASLSVPGSVVSCLSPLPSGLMLQMSQFPDFRLWKTTRPSRPMDDGAASLVCVIVTSSSVESQT